MFTPTVLFGRVCSKWKKMSRKRKKLAIPSSQIGGYAPIGGTEITSSKKRYSKIIS